MRNQQYLYNILSALISTFFIMPFVYITRFASLSADDFCRATTELKNYGKNIVDWYLHHNGRFTNAFLSYLPVYNLQIYRLVLVFSFLLLAIAILFLIRNLFVYYNIEARLSEVILMTVLFYLAIIICLPSPFEFFYWFAGTSAYMYSAILFLFISGILIKNYEHCGKYEFFTGLLILLIIGNNEMLIPLINFLLFFLLIKTLRSNRKLSNYRILVFNIISWISSLVVIFSPGSRNRQSFYSDGGEFLLSVQSAILSTGMFILKKMVDFPSVILYLGLILLILQLKTKPDTKLFVLNPLRLSLFSFIGLSSILFVPYYATGHLNVNQGRIGNMVHVIFWILFFFNMLNFTLFVKCRYAVRSIRTANIGIATLVLFFFILRFSENNYQDLISDFRSEDLQRLEKEIKNRELKIKEADGTSLELKRIIGTKIMKYYDITSTKDDWTNECYTSAMNSIFSKNFESILIDQRKDLD